MRAATISSGSSGGWRASSPSACFDAELARWLTYVLVAGTAPFIFNVTQHLALDRWIGDLSYQIYLTHVAVIGLVLAYSPPFGVWLAIGGTILLSAALLFLVDHPIDRWRQSRVRDLRGSTAIGARVRSTRADATT